ncbi:hypothetical protein ASPZODRAFT_86317 [Penicilliopsis zonata CBS 506.65]|uniref:Dienelactone hydrolase domain-containing protein n=1 Tax=Penicilliopsis zonata CBS 506.65 TaxID=1073090 RepID=A0A1L9SU56_9EURO|nr:hypothetical protein ASPZODRAFT_86317 [Penicilliopsis zonata CBS 506.65]OJJ50740.1 hypothetical protein ASPZODRAFT_86317 [Penicilliopsis zonata CBS 506.65]
MASLPPAVCCTVGIRHEGTPTGKTIQVAGVDAYIAEPSGRVHRDVAILYLPDVLGIWQNSKLMADHFAANGYYTLLLDLMNGDPVPMNRGPDFDMQGWRAHGSNGTTPHTLEAVEPLVTRAIAYLRDTLGIKKIGSVGYCFGAKYVIRSLAEGKGVDVGFIAHPSSTEEAELAAIKGPLSIAAAETDRVFPPELRWKSEDILVAAGFPWQMNLFGGVKHGFAVRGDMSVAKERYAKEQAFFQAVVWFDAHLALEE